MQARFELHEPYQKNYVMKQMGCLLRSSKSRIVKKIRETCTTNQQRMNLRPKNVSPIEWRKFVKLKTSPAFKVWTYKSLYIGFSGLVLLVIFCKDVSDKYKQKRSKQIPHTCSRKGMVRLAEDMV